MQPPDGEADDTRRSFLRSSGGLFTGLWLSAHWPSIAAAHHADEMPAAAAPAAFSFFDPADASDVEAIASQIVPSGATAGAREARAVHFIDRALASFFSAQAADFQAGLREFQSNFRALSPGPGSFAKAASDEQIAYLKTVDHRPFFGAMRNLTLLGMFSSPKYGGNYQGSGWKMMGFVDQHAFTPPFGYYDERYAGFVPYPAGGGA